jgi:predicted phosphodiesterase
MKYLIFTDIHGNLEAFKAMLDFVEDKEIDHYLFLGDLVGYGASPNEIVEMIRKLEPLSLIRGNHDKAVAGLDSAQSFNPIAASAIHWTREKIHKKNMDFLKELEKGPKVVNGDITICHGAPFDEDHYIFGEFDASEAFIHFETPLCFFGHTHFPFVYMESDHTLEGMFVIGDESEIQVEEGVQYLINPGSIGQPRDRNPKAGCAVFDNETGKITFFRIEYDIKAAQDKITAAHLPSALAERLAVGI